MTETLTESLGFDADARVAIVHADDIGMSHAANVGAFAALASGPATTGSVMVPCPWFSEAAAWARERGEAVDLGVHLTLNSEHEGCRWGPVLGASRVPSLVDAEGFFYRTSDGTRASAIPEEVELELRAQIERALEAGIDVTHLDSHMGTAMLPPFSLIYAKLVCEFQVAAFSLRVTEAVVADRADLPPNLKMLREAVDRMQASGVPVMDGFDDNSLSFGPGEGHAHNLARLSRMGPGVRYLICHPARGGEELSAITPADAHCRDFEASFYGGEAGRAALADEGIATVGMRALRDLVRQGSPAD